MFVYHFAFDLRYYGVTSADFEHDFFWLSFRALIVGIFMALVGVSLVLAERAHATPRHFWRRIAIIAACALLATVASRMLFPQTFIYFGILHAIAVASVLAWPLPIDRARRSSSGPWSSSRASSGRIRGSTRARCRGSGS